MERERMREGAGKFERNFAFFPEFAAPDRSGYRLQLNWLFWNFQMGLMGQDDFENKVVDKLGPILNMVLKKRENK